MTTTSIIPSYPYVQFSDDVNIQAWFDAHNEYVKYYLSWFVDTPLAIFTNDNIQGALLDWVANGVYGVYRVPITQSKSRSVGEINTYEFNELPLNEGKSTSVSSFQNMTDDVLKRVLTWNFYKGDGAQFTIPWIKKHVARFLYGINGFEDTNNISVAIPNSGNVIITITDEVLTTDTLPQSLNYLLANGIVNFPYGYTFSLYFVDQYMLNDDFGGDIV